MGSPTTPTSPSASSAEQQPDDADAHLAREVSRPLWRELNAESQPILVGTSEADPVVDPAGPFLWLPGANGGSLQRFDGENAAPLPTADQQIYQIREGMSYGEGPGTGRYAPTFSDLNADSEQTSEPQLSHGDNFATYGYLVDRRRVFEQSFPEAQLEDYYGEKFATIDFDFHVTQLDDTTLWQRGLREVGAWQCAEGYYRGNGISPWLINPHRECDTAINQNSGATLTYGNAVVIATYDQHIVVYEPDSEQFVSYDAAGNEERRFNVHAAALKMITPYAERVRQAAAATDPNSRSNLTVDYGLEVGYDDLVKGLQTLEAAAAAPITDDGRTSSVQWEILPGGAVVEFDMRTAGRTVLTPLDRDVHWEIACTNVTVIGGGSRAICQGGEDDGTLLQLNDDGTSTPLWKHVGGFDRAMKIFPFNHHQWVVYSGNEVLIFWN